MADGSHPDSFVGFLAPFFFGGGVILALYLRVWAKYNTDLPENNPTALRQFLAPGAFHFEGSNKKTVEVFYV